MAFEDDITRHAEQIKARLPFIKGEGAAKQSLVTVAFQALASFPSGLLSDSALHFAHRTSHALWLPWTPRNTRRVVLA
jgi:hypothetical protein